MWKIPLTMVKKQTRPYSHGLLVWRRDNKQPAPGIQVIPLNTGLECQVMRPGLDVVE